MIAGLLVMWPSDRSIRYIASDTSSSISTWPSRSGCQGVPISEPRMVMLNAAALAPGARSGDPNAEVLIFEALDKTVNKWTAIRWLAARQRIDEARVVAIGNDGNDIAMLEHAGLSIAVANSIPEALAAADRTTHSNDEHGVAHALNQILTGEW